MFSLPPSTIKALQSSLLDKPAVKTMGDNTGFNNQLQKQISSLREPTNKATKTQSSIDTETKQDPLAAILVNTTPENLFALIMNANPAPAPLDATQTNPDAVTPKLAATVKPTLSNTLNTAIELPAQNTAITPESLALSRQYTNTITTTAAVNSIEPAATAKPTLSNATSAALSPIAMASTLKPAISDTVNKAIKEPVKDAVISLQSLSMGHQHINTPIPSTLNTIKPELPANINRPEDFISALQIQSSPVIPAATYPPTNIISSAPTPTTYSITPPFDSPNWDQAINQQVVWMVQNKLQSASLTINPPHLGPVQVMMQIDNQQATVQFVSAQPEIREALQNALPLLADMLKQSGIQLGHTDVSSQQRNSDSRPSPPSKINKNSAETSVTEPVINTQHTHNTGHGLINLVV